MNKGPITILLAILLTTGCVQDPPEEEPTPDMASDQDMAAELPTAAECAAQTSEESCLALGCTRWEVAISVWTYSKDDGCMLEAQEVPFCWLNPSGRRTSSNALSYYCQSNSDGMERIAYTRSDVGEVSGWSYCRDRVDQIGCPTGTPPGNIDD